jgi:hypothetical protein
VRTKEERTRKKQNGEKARREEGPRGEKSWECKLELKEREGQRKRETTKRRRTQVREQEG